MKPLFNGLLCLFILFLGWSCSEPTAHGVTDIGNSMAGVVVSEKGAPLANAKVVLYFDDWQEESISDSLETKTDAHGQFEFSNLIIGKPWVLLAKKDSLSVISLSSDTLVLRPSKYFSSRILGKSSGWVRVLGQNEKQEVAEDGSFAFTDMLLVN